MRPSGRNSHPNNNGTHSLKCPYCGYAEAAEPCTYGAEYRHDENSHWLTCTACGYGNKEAHTLNIAVSHNSQTASCSIPVTVKPATLTEAMVEPLVSVPYSGAAQKPAITVKQGETTLTEGTDYTVGYANNVNAGAATATVTGKGNYTGTVEKKFAIKKAVPADTANYEKPALTYTVSGLASGEELAAEPTLTCEADMNTAGSYPITASGAAVPNTGNYETEITYVEGTLTVTAGGRTVTSVPGGLIPTVPAYTTPGTVAVLVYGNGAREVVRKSVAGNSRVTIPLDGSARVEIVDNSKCFYDVPAASWAADAVAFASAHELFNGTGANQFSPNLPMSRGMLATVLHNLESNPYQPVTGVFADVNNSAWYAEGVAWASANGKGNGALDPTGQATRAETAQMLKNYMSQ